MFTSVVNDVRLVQSHMGVPLITYTCYQLSESSDLYKYPVNELHYAADAMQKGLKPPTNIGLKRLRAKNAARRAKKRINPSSIP